MKAKSESEVTKSCSTLSDPLDYSLPGSSIYGIFQARVLEWLAIAFSEQYLNLCKEERHAHLREDGTLSLPGAPREQKRKEG